LTDISHQLKTPLASLRLFLELDDGAHKEEALAQADRMEALIYALLRLERMSNDGYAFRFEARQLAPLVQEAWDGLRVRFPEKRFSLTGDAVLRCDPGWLGEAFSNLLKNACEHTEPGGSVSVAITQTEREVRLTFSDDGGGVAPEELPRLFERFYQAKGQARTGSGIGLNIVREIVTRHHGTIVPENSDGGLRFTLYFPRLEQSLAKT
jgi:signal transduction histidine kinase